MTEDQSASALVYKNYGGAEVFLEEGNYSISDLEDKIALLKGMNSVARKLMELTNVPFGKT